jgi:hypothetical protein
MSKQNSRHNKDKSDSTEHGTLLATEAVLMKIHLPYLATLGTVLLLVLGLPNPSNGQSGDDPAVTELLKEVTAQQSTIAENQAKIDEKLAAVAEQVRQARLFAARAK